ncbi:MAG: dTDP-glucose 4,6-dehydratase [Caulobacteraceae bacterium]
MRALVTGGAGFIGSAVVRYALSHGLGEIGVFDALTYAASPRTLATFEGRNDFQFFHADILDADAVRAALEVFQPDVIMHLAAESHVDRSIEGPAAFVQTNVVGTQVMLDAALAYWTRLPDARKAQFRFHHISTDEVFGSLGEDGAFSESTPYDPRSPYSASKAASDHLVRAWSHTFGLPVVLTNCSNNYGPYQFPEKLIPLNILRGLRGERLPVYGDGQNVRDWLHVDDHAAALWAVLARGRVGETYVVGGESERRNLDVVKAIAAVLDELRPGGAPHARLIEFVKDRPGHDRRYAIDCSRIQSELGWRPSVSFEQGLAQTVRWYVDNEDWWAPILAGRYGLARLGAA